MNEGKPTKSTRPKWWSRPRPVPPAETESTTSGVPGPSLAEGAVPGPSVAEVAEGAVPGPSVAEGAVPGPSVAEVAEGAVPGPSVAEGAVSGSAVAEGAVPGPSVAEGAVSGSAVAEGAPAAPGSGPESVAGDVAAGGSDVGADGDYELERPAGRPGGDALSADGDFELAQPGAVVGGTGNDSGTAGALEDAAGPGSVEPLDGATGSVAPPAEPPRPLHDPDPYNTPPYGEPGPWAPAPPVQHPAVTSSPGTTAATPPDAQSTPVPPPAVPSVPVPPPAVPTAPVPPPAAHSTPVPPPAAPLASGPSPAVPASDSVPTADTPPTTDPWQRYDPWAATPLPAPLQQSGARVLTRAQRRRRVRRVLLGGALALALVSGGLGGLLGAYIERNGGVGAVQLPQAGKEPTGRAPDSVAGIAARALPSVVTLHVSGSDEKGTGTGFVLDRLGHILTNNHVVEPAASGGDISVTFSGGQTAKARIVGRDTGYDLAVVQVHGVRGLTPMPLGNSDNVQVGDPVVAIGAPFDLANTVTSGIISAKERPITAGGDKGDGSDVSYVDALQTDAPINPGNSGGPLLDTQGRVVGINSAIRSADSGSDLQTGQAGSIGLGFAIPVNQAKRVAEELINSGKADHPVIGVTLDMNYTGDGARVGTKGRSGGSPVTPGGPGAKAGIKAGDLITAVDGRRVQSGEELIVRIRAHRPGDRLELTVERGGLERKVFLVLGSSSSG
ncbi:trypsin-like peptidase domain-containing protein [Streptomyces sp. NPDC046197]|uniref:trypsin-like peptidase domain-containing protein n=1 Tax=Streptomyces sp. NPDC046197 TaxID=3154337 RepID=UPI0034101841